jgi:hypothetical protein
MEPDNYTARVAGKGNTTGMALAKAYAPLMRLLVSP